MSFFVVRRLIPPTLSLTVNPLRFLHRQFSVSLTKTRVEIPLLRSNSSISRWPRLRACNAADRLFATQTSDLPEDFEASIRTLFFGCVNQNLPEIVLEDYFGAYGKLDSLYLMKNFRGRSRGFGVAVYKDVDTAEAVLNKPHEIDEKKFEVKRAVKYRVVQIEGIPQEYSPEQVEQLFSQFGRVEKVEFPLDPDTGERKGFCILQFSKQTEALTAMQNGDKLGDELSVNIALLQSLTDRSKLPSKRVILYDLPFTVTVDELHEHFRFSCPSLREIHLRLDVTRRQCLAFLLFDSEKDVEKIVKTNTMQFGGNEITLKKIDDSDKLRSTGSWMFLENVPAEMTKTDIHRHFIQFGKMEKITLNSNKGFGHIRFYEYPSCLSACQQREHVIENHTITVRKMSLKVPGKAL